VSKEKKKILVLSAAVGAGHTTTARALVQACEMEHPEAEAVWIDSFDLCPRIYGKFYKKLYNVLAGRFPHFYGYCYDKLDHEERYEKPRGLVTLIDTLFFRRFLKRVAAEKPDIIVCTHFQPGDVVSILKRKEKIDCPVGVIVTDYYMHSFWEVKDADFYIVSTEEMKAILVEKGFAPETIHVIGIPVRPEFVAPTDRAEILEKIGCMEDVPIVLTVASGWRKRGPEVTVEALMNTGIDMQILAVAGKNKESKDRISALKPPSGVELKIFGFVDNIHEMMKVADVLVAKPGGVTTVEALAVGLPMLAINPVPGQEMGNCHYLQRMGAGALVNRLGSLKYHLRAILGDKARGTQMRECARRAGRPRAAFEIIDLLLKMHREGGRC